MTKQVPKPRGIPETYLSISEVVAHFHVSRRQVQRDKKSGELKHEKDTKGWNWFEPSSIAQKYAPRHTPDIEPDIRQDEEKAQVDTPDAMTAQGQRIKTLEERIEELEQDREERKKREEKHEQRETQLVAEKERLVGLFEKQMLLLSPPKKEEPPQPQQESIAPQVVEKPDFAASPTQEGIEIEQDTSVDAQEGISKKQKDASAPNVPQKKKNASQRQKKTKKKRGIFGLFSRK